MRDVSQREEDARRLTHYWYQHRRWHGIVYMCPRLGANVGKRCVKSGHKILTSVETDLITVKTIFLATGHMSFVGILEIMTEASTTHFIQSILSWNATVLQQHADIT